MRTVTVALSHCALQFNIGVAQCRAVRLHAARLARSYICLKAQLQRSAGPVRPPRPPK